MSHENSGPSLRAVWYVASACATVPFMLSAPWWIDLASAIGWPETAALAAVFAAIFGASGLFGGLATRALERSLRRSSGEYLLRHGHRSGSGQ